MKTKLPLKVAIPCLLLAILGLSRPTGFAQNTVFSYQGHILDNGTNFTGTGEFQFALVTSTNFSHTATATADDNSGFITSYIITYGGSGYTSVPAVTLTGGGGSNAVATAVISGGVVTSITVNNPGSGYNLGTPTVTIAPPAANISYTTYWSNDGTSANGSEPSAIVTTAVTNGLFTVVLGDTTVANMEAIGAAVFDQPNLQLRIWFDDGTHGFSALSPLQNLTPTPYAVFATTASNFNGTVSATQISGAVGSANLAGLYTSAVTLSNAGNIFTGSFSGNGAGLTNLSVAAANVSGTLTLAQMPAPVLTNNETGITLQGSFSGNGGGLTNLSVLAANVSGTLALSQLPSAVLTNNETGIALQGSFSGNGAGVTNIPLAGLNSYNSLGLATNGPGFVLAGTPRVGSAAGQVIAFTNLIGDGKVELVAISSDTTFTILTNNGAGVFGSNITYSAGASLASVAAGDLNGDGFPDLVLADYENNGLLIFTNNGHGVFVFATAPPLGPGNEEPIFVTTADVNGDGKLDILVANIQNIDTGGSTVTVLTNAGQGIFAIASSPIVGNETLYIAVADMNADGKPDFLAANYYDNTVSEFLNTGGGIFVSNFSRVVSPGPVSVAVADVNGDGAPDVISASTNGTLTILTNNALPNANLILAGSLMTAAIFDYEFPIAAVDINGDGKIDLIVPNFAGNALTVLTNSGNAAFGIFASLPVGTGPYWVVGADLNGDGKPDLLCGNTNGTISVLLNTLGLPSADLTVDSQSGGLRLSVGYLGVPNVIGGSSGNLVDAGVSGAAIGGGAANWIQAGANYGFIGSGFSNRVGGAYATIPGGYNNVATGQYSFAAGNQAQALFQGDFVWADSQNAPFVSTANDQFLIRAQGGVGIGTTNPVAPLDVDAAQGYVRILSTSSSSGSVLELRNNTSGAMYTGAINFMATNVALGQIAYQNDNAFHFRVNDANDTMKLSTSGLLVNGAMSFTSDRNAKENFIAINPEQVLAKVASLPLTVWNYKKDSKEVQHLGPMAQDFQAAFRLDGDDDKHISISDEGGVALAAIQGLNQKLEEQRGQLEQKQTAITELKQRLEKLEQMMNEKNGGGK